MGPEPAESAPSNRAEPGFFGPGFFLSHARAFPLRGERSDPDYWVERFFHELAHEIRSLDGDLAQGFISGHVRPGEDPEALAARSLASCRIFVPLYSDDYFADEECGREWAVFEQRRKLRRARTGDDGDSILPVLWTRQVRREWPECARRVRPRPSPADGLYERLGLFELIRLHEPAYREVARLLAEEIVRRAHTEAPPVAAPDALSSVDPAFPDSPPTTRRLFIRVVAGVRRDIPSERSAGYYGDHPEDWRPYHPESPEPIAARAARIARGLGYRPEVSVLSSTSPETRMNGPRQPLEARRLQPPAASVVLADPWHFRRHLERRDLERVDRHRREWVRLMVPWCATDHETSGHRPSLESHIRDAAPWMSLSWRRTCPPRLENLATAEEFDLALPVVIDRARSRLLDRVGPSRDADVPSGAYSGRPRLAPPSGDEPLRREPG